MNFTYNAKNATEHKRFKIDNFLGVDYASTKINANKSRAVDMKNFINRDGVNRKRFGWNEVLKIVDNLGNPLPINGFWYFTDSNKVEHKIIHAGNRIFKITTIGQNSFESEYEDITPVELEEKILNQRSFGLVRGDYLYLFLGKVYAMYGKWNNNDYELRAVENGEKTYIPTTTIGISAIGSLINSRQVLEEVNLLTNKRRNKLIAEPLDKEAIRIDLEDKINNSYFENSQVWGSYAKKGFVINNETLPDIDFIRIDIASELGSKSYEIPIIQDGVPKTYDESNPIFSDGIEAFTGKATITYTYGYNNNFTLTLYIGTLEKSNINAYIYKKYVYYQLDTKDIDYVAGVKVWANGEYKGIVGNVGSEVEHADLDDVNGILKLPYDFIANNQPLISGENNIIVEFTKTVSGNADKINNCSFGTIFGYNDLENLFVSGNPDLPNMDFHSNIPDSTESTSGIPVYDDLTYFGDLSYAVMGSKQSKIMGYTLLEDGTLAIHKEAYKNEPSIYIRTASIDNVVDISGNIVYDTNGNPYKRVVYPQFAGNISEGMITPFASANLAGDKLFLSKNGVYGIVMNANIKSNERFARERSRLINPLLEKIKNLEDACAIAYDNRYYLSINGKCYIADSRFKNQYAPEMDDTFSYEWWVWDNINARIWFVLDGILGFGTDLGQICLFNKEDFVDTSYNLIYLGGITIDVDNFTFTINSTYDEIITNMKDGDKLNLQISGDGILGEKILDVSDFLENVGGTIKVDFVAFIDTIRYLENAVVYIDDNTEEVYTIKNIDFDNNTFELRDVDDNLFLGNITDNLSRSVENDLFSVNGFDSDLGTFNLVDDRDNVKVFKIIGSSDPITDLIGCFEKQENIETLWLTPMFDLGTAEYSKNLHSITLTPESVVGGKIEFGYRTRAKDKEFAMDGVNLLDFNEIDFTNFTFETSTFAKSDTRRIKVKNFNFIQLYFKSDNDKDCIVNNLSITYSLSKLNKGVK
jgi:hypothetical protein